VLFRGRSEEKVRAAAEHFARCLREPGVEILGPAAAPVMRVKDAYRWHVILKAGSRTELVQVLRRAQAAYAAKPVRGVAVGIDIDPQATM
ncbi:MAG: primosomal protein N', partial [Bacillota bacterium]